MAFGIKFTPLTPGVHPHSSPVSLTPEEDASLDNLRQVDFEAYKRELIALRERDMAITKPTQPEYFARPRHSAVQIVSPPTWSDDFNFDYDYGLLTQPFSDIDLSSYTSPTHTEFDQWAYSAPDELSPCEINELIQSLYLDGCSNSDLDSWELYQEIPELNVSEIADGIEDLMLVDDDTFLTPLEAEFNPNFSIPSPATSGSEFPSTSSSPTSLTSSTYEF